MYALSKSNNRLSLGEEQGMLLDSARAFCAEKSPRATVRALLEAEPGHDTAAWREMSELGWPGIAIPEAYGGSGMGLGAVVGIAESMGRHLMGGPLISTTLAAQLLLRAGSAQQREMWLPRIAAGAAAAIGLYESGDMGSEIGAELVAQGAAYRLRGRKCFVNDGAAAELLVVVARGEAGLVLVCVDASELQQGTICAHQLVDQTKRSASLVLDDIEVSPSAVADMDAAAAVEAVQLIGALLVAAESTGAAAACLDTMVDYLKTRKQFGRLIGSFQALKHPAVDILQGMDAARSLIYHAATLLAEGDAEFDVDVEIACRMAKVQANEVLSYAGDRAVQFHGGLGFTWDCDAQLFNRRAQWALQQFGDSRFHRRLLAELLL